MEGKGGTPLTQLLCAVQFTNDGKDECVTGISPDRDVIWTLGQVFLRSFYTVFDRDLNRIGFARLPRTEFQAINAHADAEAQNFLETHAANGGAGALDFAALLATGATTHDQVVWAERADSHTPIDSDSDSDSDADSDEDGDAQEEAEQADE